MTEYWKRHYMLRVAVLCTAFVRLHPSFSTFLSFFSFNRYCQVGNAVSVPLATALGYTLGVCELHGDLEGAPLVDRMYGPPQVGLLPPLFPFYGPYAFLAETVYPGLKPGTPWKETKGVYLRPIREENESPTTCTLAKDKEEKKEEQETPKGKEQNSAKRKR